MKEYSIKSDTTSTPLFDNNVEIIETFLQLCSVTYVLLVHMAATISLILILYLPWFYPYFRVFALAYLMWVFYSSIIAFNGTKKYNGFRWNKFKHYYRQYFPVRLFKTVELVPEKNYLLVLYPHSFQAHSVISNFLLKFTVVDNIFPCIDFHVVTLKAYFYLPILREHLLIMGACPATESSITTLLLSKPSKAAVLLAGGAREVSLQRPGKIYTIIKHRKGFVRIALKTGTCLVPAFSFGENRIFDQHTIDCILLTNILNIIQKITGFRIILPKGRGFFQTKFGILPRRTPINTVVGKPIIVPKVENPSETLVDEYHGIFFKALRELFDKYKELYDPAGCDAQLMMV